MHRFRPGLTTGIFLVCLTAFCMIFQYSYCTDIPDGLYLSRDSQGEYAGYVIKKGDTVWGSIVERYIVPSKRSTSTAEAILKRSGISDARNIHEGAEIKIPLDLLSTQAIPRQRARTAKPLDGVVVILDPGHGGIDTGARGRGGIYEDEVVYDIACRLKKNLEEKTGAEVFMTVRDRSMGFAVNNTSNLFLDTDEYIQTTPPYLIRDTKTGVNLRWYLANSIFRRKTRSGTPPSKIIFISIHADSLGSGSRGTVVYYAGSKNSAGSFRNPSSAYRRFAEVREAPNVSLTAKQRTDSEKISKRFSDTVISSLRNNRVMVFRNKPVRDHINRGSIFVPAVLKYNLVPTKVLIETVNLANSTDRERAKSPSFRELYAKALMEALIEFYK